MQKFPSEKHQAEYEKQLEGGLRDAELSGIRQKLLEIGTAEETVNEVMEQVRTDLDSRLHKPIAPNIAEGTAI
jgi:hypothetical protein